MQAIPERWQFCFDNKNISLRDLSWPQAVQVFREAETGELAGQATDECVSLEFNATDAAVLYLGPKEPILRPYFSWLPAAAQDLRPFFCGCCGIRLGKQAHYLARFLLRRADGFRLFAAVLAGPPLPAELPDPQQGQPVLPGLEEAVAAWTRGRALEWRPVPSGEAKHAEPS